MKQNELTAVTIRAGSVQWKRASSQESREELTRRTMADDAEEQAKGGEGQEAAARDVRVSLWSLLSPRDCGL